MQVSSSHTKFVPQVRWRIATDAHRTALAVDNEVVLLAFAIHLGHVRRGVLDLDTPLRAPHFKLVRAKLPVVDVDAPDVISHPRFDADGPGSQMGKVAALLGMGIHHPRVE
jgi:hypothetical protein